MVTRNVSQDVRYQVFVSSTYTDLQEERQEVIQALLELDCIPAGMELFPASDDDKWSLIESVIDDCDYYIVIIGGRYGSMDPAYDISYTEREYDYALQSEKPVLAFLHGEPSDIKSGRTDENDELARRLRDFRAKAEEKMCRYWTTPQDLGGVVSRSLIKAMKTTPREGWIRARHAQTSETTEELADLRNRVMEYEEAQEKASQSAPPGSERFSQGNDECSLNWGLRYRSEVSWQPKSKRGTTKLTWNECLSIVGPLMFDEASEAVVDDALEEAVWRTISVPKDYGQMTSFDVDSPDIHKVRVQFVVLGLIEKSKRRRGVNDRNTYWKLSAYGERQVMELLAVPRTESGLTEAPNGVAASGLPPGDSPSPKASKSSRKKTSARRKSSARRSTPR